MNPACITSLLIPGYLAGELCRPGRSQTALAKAIGADPSVINKLCRGKRDVTLSEAVAITEYLALTASTLKPQKGER